jgi:hypothetical protein
MPWLKLIRHLSVAQSPIVLYSGMVIPGRYAGISIAWIDLSSIVARNTLMEPFD